MSASQCEGLTCLDTFWTRSSGWAAAACLRLLERLLQRVRERDPADQLLDVRFQQIATGHLGMMRASVSTQGALWLSGAAAHMIVQGSSQRLECTIARVLGMVVEEHRAAAPHKLARDRAAHSTAANDAHF